ncbi:fluoride efflux transporter CrcB [Aliishimia ponticola]|uniref:Fluoride-specific ion channel FluC n=1 Tax=Aliishimia ponticola TaxID=2499833 RepID=A0A4S4NEJ4_9RHOB|nr:fluoride efflux transporter CrcB [Aliishimia ponticola]THH34470.1 fluoride efflux transporter CrcB [Aliishimia ponticola]
MLSTLSFVALGGALGASLRWLWGVGVLRLLGPSQFPVAVMGANILGSFLMGLFVVVAAQRGLTHLSPFVMTGLLGGFTTFSAFSLETMTLIERGQITSALIYVALSVGCSIAGLALGLLVARSVMT